MKMIFGLLDPVVLGAAISSARVEFPKAKTNKINKYFFMNDPLCFTPRLPL